ncbi:MAG: molybdopterin-guanine dinucleotide biosynthesis protein B [Calditrichaeota bacterium]|nr:MAG: molybdopterin-guanine dinucleotide biosynthesis protein B [Calditrichota bacterium]
MIPKVIEIIGSSGAGKTTLIEKMIPEIRLRGYRLAVIKHTSHRHEFDRPGKDSYRMRKAGAEVVLVSSPAMFALFRDVEKELSLQQILAHVPEEFDLVLAEGYKDHSFPALEVYRPPVSKVLLANEKPQILAVISDAPLKLNIPQFSPSAIEAIVDFIEGQMA